MRAKMSQGLVDISSLRCILSVAQRLIAGPEIGVHGSRFDACLLHDVEGFARIDSAQLLPVPYAGEAVELKQIGEAHQLFLVGIADHRGFVEQHRGAAQRRASLGKPRLVRSCQKALMLAQEARNRHRGNAGVPLEHLYERVLDSEPEHGLAFLAQDVCNRFEDGTLAGASYALNGHNPVVRGEKQAPCPFLARVQCHAIFELRERL